MKNLFKIFVVVAGMASALYSCETKQADNTVTTPDSIPATAAPDSLATPEEDSTTTAKEDSTK
jgi:hypothetical protein